MAISKWFPLDLISVVALALLPVALVAAGIPGSLLRLAATLPLVLLLPGYALVAALYPETSTPGGGDGDHRGRADDSQRSGPGSLSGVERFALSLAASLAIVPMVAFVLNFVTGLTVRPLLFGVVGVTLLGCLVAYVRRMTLPPSRRASVAPLQRLGAVTGRYFRPSSRSFLTRSPFEARSGGDVVLNLVVVASLGLLVTSAGVAALTPQSQPHSEFYLVDGDGRIPVDGTALDSGAGDLSIVVENHEHERVHYTVVVRVEQVTGQGDSLRVTDSRRVAQYDRSVGPDGTWTRSVAPDVQGDGSTRVVFELYKRAPSGGLDARDPALTLRLWAGGGPPGGN